MISERIERNRYANSTNQQFYILNKRHWKLLSRNLCYGRIGSFQLREQCFIINELTMFNLVDRGSGGICPRQLVYFSFWLADTKPELLYLTYNNYYIRVNIIYKQATRRCKINNLNDGLTAFYTRCNLTQTLSFSLVLN